MQEVELPIQSSSSASTAADDDQSGASRHGSFASKISHQVPTYVSWKLDQFNKGRDAFQITWTHLKGYAFPPFASIGRVLNKVQKEKAISLLITTAWQTQSWYPLLLQLTVRIALLLPKTQNLLLGPNREKHPLIEQGNLQLLAWAVSERLHAGVSEDTAALIRNAR